MGWKAIKETFGIESHIVCVNEKRICIGSGYVHDLVTIDLQTGHVVESSTFNGFLRRHYPDLEQAKPEQVLSLIQAQDTFTASIPVYTYGDGKIIEKHCEVVGWPNVTHDGDVMYENTYSTDKDVIVAKAKRDAELEVTGNREHIERLREQLAEALERLGRSEAKQAMLANDYPDNEATYP